MTEPAAVRFFHVWDTYAKVVASNYMFHAELGEAIKAILHQRFGARPFSILDLGCGDAATFAPLLGGFAVKAYRGADLSEAALALARQNLTGLACPVVLTRTDFMDELARVEPHDLIYISFALHHLTTEQKAEFFRLAAHKLAPGGLLLVADVVREEGQSLPDYLDAYSAYLREVMVALDDAEREEIRQHIVSFDLPEPRSLLQAQAETAGLRVLEAATPHKWHGLLPFAKA